MADRSAPSPTLAGGSPPSDLRQERLGRGGLLADWILANASKQKFDLENAVLKKTFGGEFSTIPFGNTVLIQGREGAEQLASSAEPQASSGWTSRLAPLALGAALATTGLGGAALAFPAFAQLFRSGQPDPPAPGVIEFPVQIDWNFNPHGGTVQPK